MTIEMRITVENDEQKDAIVACLVQGEEEGDLPFGFSVQVIHILLDSYTRSG